MMPDAWVRGKRPEESGEAGLTRSPLMSPNYKRRRRWQSSRRKQQPCVGEGAAAAASLDALWPRTRAVAKGALVVFLAGGVGTGVTAFSAVVSAPPRQRPHHRLVSTTNAHEEPTPRMVPSPALLGVPLPQTRQFLEDIISGQAAAAATAATHQQQQQDRQQKHERKKKEKQQQQQQQRNLGSNNTILTEGAWEGAAGGVFRLKEEPSAAAAVAGSRPAPLPREPKPTFRQEQGEEVESAGLPTKALRRKRSAAVPAKKAKPKYGYRRSSNKRTQAVHDMCAELCQTGLLTKAEEHELGTKIQKFMRHKDARLQLAAELGRAPSWSEWAGACRLTVVELEESLQAGADAKKTMVEANMRMVISIARKYRHYGVPLQDLIQEGSMGLIRAVEKFDPERGFKLSTYSAWWIQQAVFKGIASQSRTIRLPMHVHNLLNKVRRARRELAISKGQRPSDHQVAGYLDIPVKRLRHYLDVTQESLSFELPLGPGTGSPNNQASGKDLILGDTLVDKYRTHPEREGDERLFRARLRELVEEELSEDERMIVSLRFGLGDGKSKSLRQIAEIVRTPQLYVRRVESMALRKLRSSKQQRRLQDFVLHSTGPSPSPSSRSSSSSLLSFAPLSASSSASASASPSPSTASPSSSAPAASSSSLSRPPAPVSSVEDLVTIV